METPPTLLSPSAVYLSQYSTTELLLIAQSIYETGTAEYKTAANLLATHPLLKQKKGELGADVGLRPKEVVTCRRGLDGWKIADCRGVVVVVFGGDRNAQKS